MLTLCSISPLLLTIKSIYVYAVSWVCISSAIMFQISTESASKIDALIPIQVNNNIFSYRKYTFTFTTIWPEYCRYSVKQKAITHFFSCREHNAPILQMKFDKLLKNAQSDLNFLRYLH